MAFLILNFKIKFNEGCEKMRNKVIENYYDSKIYTNSEILEDIKETKKEFSEKKVDVDISINDYGVYIVTYYFKNKENIFQKIMIKIKQRKKKRPLLDKGIKEEKNIIKEKIIKKEKNKTKNIKKTKEERKKENIRKRLEKYSGNQYGKYKETKTYRPY